MDARLLKAGQRLVALTCVVGLAVVAGAQWRRRGQPVRSVAPDLEAHLRRHTLEQRRARSVNRWVYAADERHADRPLRRRRAGLGQAVEHHRVERERAQLRAQALERPTRRRRTEGLPP